MENGSFEVTSRFSLLILFLCLCAVLVVPVSAATWYDDFSSDTSGNYSGDTGNFVWGPTNLSGNIANSQAHINSTSYSYGRYQVFLNYSGDSQSGIVLSSDSDTETGYPLNKGNKYFIGIKNDWWANPDGLILYKIVAGGISDWVSADVEILPNRQYNLTILWSAGLIKMYLDGANILDYSDNTFTGGYTGLIIIDDQTGWTYFDNYQINETATSAFTCTPLIGTAPFSTTCTQSGDNHDDPGVTYQWSWDDGTANSTDEDPSHQYTAAGTYDVTLCVSNVAGTDCHTEAGYIDVGNAPPPGMYTGTAGDEVSISGSIWLAALMIMGTIVVFVGRR